MNSFKILKGNKIINKKGSLLKYFNKNSLPKKLEIWRNICFRNK